MTALRGRAPLRKPPANNNPVKPALKPSSPWPASAVEMRPITSLRPYDKNARLHPDFQIAQIAESMRTFGFTIPVLVDETGLLIAGHGRLLAAKHLVDEGRKEFGSIPVMTATGWTDAQRRAYTLIDNRLSETSSWDDELLRSELGQLSDLDMGSLGFDDLFVQGIGAPLAGDIDALGEWGGMPEFDQDAKSAFRSIRVHFPDQKSVNRFAKLVEQPITDKTRWLWFPEVQIERHADKRYQQRAGKQK